MMRLIFLTGPHAGTEINTSAQRVRVGRDPGSNDLVLEDPTVSARHIILERSPRGDYVLEDLGTTNGTLVNDQQVTTVGQHQTIFLSSGDRFKIGNTEVEVSEGIPRFMIISGPKAGLNIPITDETITFGRAPDCTVEIDDPKVSGLHSAMVCQPVGFELKDNNSTNGTYVNGHRITSHYLGDGDAIEIGNIELRFLIDEPRLPAAARAHGGEQRGTAYAHLHFVSGPHEDESQAIGDDQVIFGRRDDCTFSISDLQVSAMHCAVTRTDTGFVLTDLRSSNGTFVNGRRITESQPLNPGDLVQFGECVAEFRVAGGVAAEDGSATTTTMMMTNQLNAAAFMPKFVIGDAVMAALHIQIGSDSSSQLWLQSEGVEKVHATITWDDGFVIEDKSRNGTYVNDKRVVKEKLQTGHVIRIGENVINVSIRGDRCNLETIDAVAAMAAIEVARETAFDIRQAQFDAPNTGWQAQEPAYQTVFKLDLPDIDALVEERKKEKLKTGAPAWRPSTDIIKDAIGKYAVIGTMAASLVVCALLYATSSDAALMNHPLSEGHSSVRFAQWAQEKGAGTGCQSCHAPGNGVPVEKCTLCHADYNEHSRDQHVDPPADKMKAHQVSPGNQCSTCHVEHIGTPRSTDPRNPSLLGAERSCGSGACHPNQHVNDFEELSADAPLVVKAGPVPDFDRQREIFHADHAMVEQDGKQIAIGCTACHAAKDGEELVESNPGKSCFRCHASSKEQITEQCTSCHGNEHDGAVALVRTEDPELIKPGGTTLPTGFSSIGLAGGIVIAAFAPFLFVALIRRSRRKGRTEAMVTKLREFPVETVKRLVHSINRDKCVGCHMCVQACPASVLELVNHKSTIVNFDACIQCRKCESACAFDALRMHEADKPPPMIAVPQVDTAYQTPVEGMYLIGQAAGTPQVKNASNLGTAVAYHMVKEGGLQPGTGRRIGAQTDVVIVGSGPGGLSAAIACIELGLEYKILEKQRDFSWTIRSYYHKGKPVMAEPNDVDMAGRLPHWDSVREELLDKWAEYVQHYNVQIDYQQNVTNVEKKGEVFHVTTSDAKDQPTGTVTGARVVVAIGTMGNPRMLGCPGDDQAKVSNALVDPDEFQGKNILVVGGSDAAIEVVLALCGHNKVWLSYRKAKFGRAKPKNLQAIEEAIASGKCIAMFSTTCKEIGPQHVTLEHKADKRQEQLPNDAVFAMIGGHPPTKFLKAIGVPYVDKPHSWSPPRTDELVQKYAGQA